MKQLMRKILDDNKNVFVFGMFEEFKKKNYVLVSGKKG